MAAAQFWKRRTIRIHGGQHSCLRHPRLSIPSESVHEKQIIEETDPGFAQGPGLPRNARQPPSRLPSSKTAGLGKGPSTPIFSEYGSDGPAPERLAGWHEHHQLARARDWLWRTTWGTFQDCSMGRTPSSGRCERWVPLHPGDHLRSATLPLGRATISSLELMERDIWPADRTFRNEIIWHTMTQGPFQIRPAGNFAMEALDKSSSSPRTIERFYAQHLETLPSSDPKDYRPPSDDSRSLRRTTTPTFPEESSAARQVAKLEVNDFRLLRLASLPTEVGEGTCSRGARRSCSWQKTQRAHAPLFSTKTVPSVWRRHSQPGQLVNWSARDHREKVVTGFPTESVRWLSMSASSARARKPSTSVPGRTRSQGADDEGYELPIAAPERRGVSGSLDRTSGMGPTRRRRATPRSKQWPTC